MRLNILQHEVAVRVPQLISLAFAQQPRSNSGSPHDVFREEGKLFGVGLEEVGKLDKQRVFFLGLQHDLEQSIFRHLDDRTAHQYFVGLNELFGLLAHFFPVGVAYCDQDDAVGPALLDIWVIGPDFELLVSVEVLGDVLFVVLVVVVPGPILRVDALVGVMDGIVDEDVFVFGDEEYVDGLAFLPRNIVEMIGFGKVVDFERTPNGIVQ